MCRKLWVREMPKGSATGTGIMLRDWLLKNQKGSPYGFYKYMQQDETMIKKKYHVGNYQSVRTLFYMLSEKLNMIYVSSRVERNGRTISYYSIVKGHEYDDAWKAVYRYAYPDLYEVKHVKD